MNYVSFIYYANLKYRSVYAENNTTLSKQEDDVYFIQRVHSVFYDANIHLRGHSSGRSFSNWIAQPQNVNGDE